MGSLTTHVLDTATGRPAVDMLIDLWRLGPDGSRTLVKSVRSNCDGRTDEALLAGEAFQRGSYELMFHVGDYLQQLGSATTAPPFFDLVPVRFRIPADGDHYHVPLLLSPWSYTTYRGS